MQQIKLNRSFIKMLTLIMAGFIALSFTTKFGLDSYEIYLNNKIMLKQTVNQPISLRMLQLTETNKNDQLRIVYTHCTNKGAGTDRTIILKDENGRDLKKWAFDNTAGADLGMSISVKELLNLENANGGHQLSLYYTAKELQKIEMLSTLHFK